MGNMGLQHLELVRPVDFLNDEAFARSAGNEQILQDARVRYDLNDAIGDCQMVIGTSARSRTVSWPTQSPEASMRSAVIASDAGRNVALLFGPERTGLANHHVDRCDVLVRIPVNPESPSINLAGAVLVMLYEVRKAMDSRCDSSLLIGESNAGARPATSAQLSGFFDHMERVVRETGFITEGPRESLLRKIRRIFVRSGMTDEDVNILRGVFTAILKQRPAAVRKSSLDDGHSS